MNKGELLTRITVWIALAGYGFGAAGALIARQRLIWHERARWAWTVGCLGLLAHAVCAFNYYHAWSHTEAYRETARQTAEVFGLDWGGGLFINYALVAAWTLDVIWWWGWPEYYRRRPRWFALAWHLFLIFIIFNAAVVFKNGALRWLGLGGCVGLGILWWATRESTATESHAAGQRGKGMIS